MVRVHSVIGGTKTGSETYSTGGSIPVKIKLSDSATEVWVNGTKEFDWGASSGSGGVAFGGWQAKFDNIKVGYDTNDDDDLDDVGDDLVFSQDFSSTSDTFAYDDAGNLVKDGEFIYTYDAWHRLVTAVSAEDTDITIGTYAYDALGRRIKKVVTNAGDLDGTELYFYGKGHQVIEVRDGSENMIRQVIHGTQYIDEPLFAVFQDGVAFVHQDANYNVIALTDFASQTLEHTYYTPYGIQTVDQETYWGDSDGDGLVTEDEWDTDTDGQLDSDDDCWGSDPTGVCRLLDFDFDNDVDAADATRLAELDSTTTYRRPGQPYSGVGNTRAHQGLIFDAELGSYQDRHRQYAASLKRFVQCDPLAFLHARFDANEHYDGGLNLYRYANGNPLTYRDPDGRLAICHLRSQCEKITTTTCAFQSQGCAFDEMKLEAKKILGRTVCLNNGCPVPCVPHLMSYSPGTGKPHRKETYEEEIDTTKCGDGKMECKLIMHCGVYDYCQCCP